MTEKQIRDLFAVWQTRLGLEHWHIQVNIFAFEPNTNCMEVARSENYNRATVTVQEWVLTGEKPSDCEPGCEFTDFEVERNIVHELLHCAVKDVRFTSWTLEDHVNPAAWDVYENVLRNAEERVVDALATALVEAWPK